jgi:hypothetical protein
MPNKKIKENHRFLDEAGDSTFYGKGKTNIIGTQGVSRCFILGMVKYREPLDELRLKIDRLQQEIAENELFQVPSVVKKRNSEGGYYFHATDDLPEVRLKVFEMIKQLDCSFEAVVGRKDIERYETKHKGKEEYFYADLLSHLLKNKLAKGEKMVLHIAEKGKSTKHSNLDLALRKAIQRYQNGVEKVVNTSVVFNVAYPTQEPLLNVADYFCWAIQRVFERGETRYYNYLKDKISLVIDVYDSDNYKKWSNYYTPKNPLTSEKQISPQLH